MTKLRASSYVIFKLLKAAGYIEILDSTERHRFNTDSIYETLREVLALIDNIDENVTIRATVQDEEKLSAQAFLISRNDLDADEEVINYVETDWAKEIMAQYEKETCENCLVEFMKYMMEEADCREDLYQTWNYGEFSSIQFEWPDCPPEAFYFSDTELFAKC